MKTQHPFRPFLWLLSSLVALLPLFATAAEEPITALATAIGKGDLERVEKLLAGGADPNQRVPDSPLQYTPLFFAVEANQTAITRTLLKAGADPKIEDGNGDPVMTMAADPEHLAQAKALIEHGVSIDLKNGAGITALLRVARHAKPEEIQTLVDFGANPDLTDPEGNSAMMIAAENDKLTTVEILLKAGATPDLRNKKGNSALQLVFNPDGYEEEAEGAAGIVKLLIKSGADINQRDPEGRSLLLRALDSLYLKPAAVQVLLEAKPDLRARDKDGQDALLLTVRMHNAQFPPQRLIELGADVKTVDHDNFDSLMQAALISDPDLIRFFLDQGLSPKSRTKQGSSAVHYAAQCGTWLNSDENGNQPHVKPWRYSKRSKRVADRSPSRMEMETPRSITLPGQAAHGSSPTSCRTTPMPFSETKKEKRRFISRPHSVPQRSWICSCLNTRTSIFVMVRDARR